MSGVAPSLTPYAFMLCIRKILPSVYMTSSRTSRRKITCFNLHSNRCNRNQEKYQYVEPELFSYEDLAKMWNCFFCYIIKVFETTRYVGPCHKDMVSPQMASSGEHSKKKVAADSR